MLPQFIEVGRLLTMRRHGDIAESGTDGGAALALWSVPVQPTSRKPKSSEPMRLMPIMRRKKRKRRKVENVGPGKRIIRRPGGVDRPHRPKDWRATAIRAAWAVRDWWTLKALGEIDEIPEP